MTQPHSWWQTGVIYQIYPRSFLDSNGDGVGDLSGITSKLDYVRWLGADAIWLSPIYPSPMADFGYDITNYTAVHPLFGTLEDLDTLLEQAHQRDLKVILDFVPNHTSDEHPWFQESRSSRTSEQRDWYIWRDPAPDGGPPNNWTSYFGGTAWQFDEQSRQYYLHLFDVKQPDLNWRNPRVRQTMFDVLRFWLDRGVDGFRIDVLWMLFKDEQFRDNPMNPDWKPGDPPYTRQMDLYTGDQPEMHSLAQEMRAIVDLYVFARWSMRMKVLSPQGPGRTGCWAIMIGPALPLVWDGTRREWPRCCYSRCAERLPATMETNWECRTWQFRQS